MPRISKAAHARLLLELSVVNGQWQHIQKFLTDEHYALSPIYDRWLAEQDNED
jgi:hypothetical protein